MSELEQGVAAAYAAKTLGELVPLTADLPESFRSKPQAPRRAAEGVPPRAAAPSRSMQLAPVRFALGLFLVNVLIWAAVSVGASERVYFWPVWTAIPLVFATVGLLGQRR